MPYLPFHTAGLATSAGGRDSGQGYLEEWLSERERPESVYAHTASSPRAGTARAETAAMRVVRRILRVY